MSGKKYPKKGLLPKANCLVGKCPSPTVCQALEGCAAELLMKDGKQKKPGDQNSPKGK